MSGDDVRDARERLGKTQAAFAAWLGVERNTVWRWENGWPVSAAWAELIRMKCADLMPLRSRQRDAATA